MNPMTISPQGYGAHGEMPWQVNALLPGASVVN